MYIGKPDFSQVCFLELALILFAESVRMTCQLTIITARDFDSNIVQINGKILNADMSSLGLQSL